LWLVALEEVVVQEMGVHIPILVPVEVQAHIELELLQSGHIQYQHLSKLVLGE
tara:strand:+ start:359 stop:517 length:159 start_codon:yes stop_codon:yes gene_type:complete